MIDKIFSLFDELFNKNILFYVAIALGGLLIYLLWSLIT